MWGKNSILDPNFWFRIIRSPASALRADSSEVVLLWRYRNDPWSGCVPLYPSIGLFWNRPNEYSNRRPFTVGLGIEWFTTFDFESNIDKLESCSSKGKPIQSIPTKSIVGMTSSHTGLINKSNRAPQPTRGQIKSFKIPHTTMDADIPLLWSGLMAKLVYRTTIFGISSAEITWTPSWETSELEGTVFNNRPWRSFKGLYRRSRVVLRSTNAVSGTYNTTQ